MRRIYLPILLCLFNLLFLQMQDAISQDLAFVQHSRSDQGRVNKEELKVLLKLIENKFDVYFAFETAVVQGKQLEGEARITDNLEETLVNVLNPFRLTFKKIGDGYYSIFPKKDLEGNDKHSKRDLTATSALVVDRLPDPVFVSPVFPLAHTVSGVVRDDLQQPVPGVNILEKGTTNGTVTDADGRYSLSVSDDNAVLIFSFIGFVTQEVVVNGRTNVDVTLAEDVQRLSEVVVVGYGTQRKSDLTGSVGSVDNEALMERPAINVEQSLSGRIAGVNVSTNSGRPGGRTRIAIRGYSSVNASSEPLYVVDGIVWTTGINNLNPNDIASIDVLKDASSTAIYGTRGSNGVIMITTKRGKTGGGQITYDSYWGVNWLPKDRKLDVLNAKEFLYIEEQQYKNAPKYDPVGFANGKYTDPVEKRKKFLVGNTLGNRELFQLDENGVPQPLYDVDWQDMSTRKAISQSHNLSFTGGDELSNYGLFLGYTNENGIIKESFAKRFVVRGVLDRQMKDWLKVGGSISYSRYNEGGMDDSDGSYEIVRRFVEFVPFIPYKYADGTYGTAGDYEGLERQDNPLTEINEIVRSSKSNAFSGNTYVNFKILPGLEFTSTLGANISNRVNPFFRSSRLRSNRNETNINSSESLFWQWSNRLNYSKDLTEDHSINVLAGIEAQSYDYLNWTARTRDMPDDYYMWNNLGAGATPLAPGSSTNEYQMESYFGRVNYNFREKYLLTVTGRYDGSSRFGADNKFAFFPSTAVAWRLSEEPFLKNSHVISDLKLRSGYGLTGNSEIGSYRSLANLSTNDYVIGGKRVTGAAIGRLANPILQWEKTAEFNVGLNLGVLNNKVSLEADYYIRKTRDLLFDAPVPSTSGYTTVTKNIGNIENKGIEVSLNTYNINRNKFSWSTTFNFSKLTNTITALGANNEDILYGFKEGLILRVGESAGSIYGYERQGIWQIGQEAEAAKYGQQPGDLRIVDQNIDGVINGLDRVIIGKGIPDFYGTFSNTFRYGNFDLLVELQYMSGNDVFNNSRNSGEARQGIANSYATVLDAWTPENQDAILEEVRPTGAYYHYYMDTRKLDDGSFIRGKNLSLGYQLPTEISTRWGLKNLRVYASMQNFFLLTNYFGYDPEVSNYDDDPFSQGITYADYPKPRTFMMGLNVSF